MAQSRRLFINMKPDLKKKFLYLISTFCFKSKRKNFLETLNNGCRDRLCKHICPVYVKRNNIVAGCTYFIIKPLVFHGIFREKIFTIAINL